MPQHSLPPASPSRYSLAGSGRSDSNSGGGPHRRAPRLGFVSPPHPPRFDPLRRPGMGGRPQRHLHPSSFLRLFAHIPPRLAELAPQRLPFRLLGRVTPSHPRILLPARPLHHRPDALLTPGHPPPPA